MSYHDDYKHLCRILRLDVDNELKLWMIDKFIQEVKNDETLEPSVRYQRLRGLDIHRKRVTHRMRGGEQHK